MIVGLDHSFLTIQDGGEDTAALLRRGARARRDSAARGPPAPGGVWFQAGGQELHLGTDDAHLSPKRPHPGFRVGSSVELDEAAERLTSNRYDVEWDEAIEGRRRFYTRDPFGNRIELLADL